MDMEIVNIERARLNAKKDSVFVRIYLDDKSLAKFPMQIMYSKEDGFDKFVLDYSYERVKFSFHRIAQRIVPNVLNSIRNYNVSIGIAGLPRCVFEMYFLTPKRKFEFENRLFFYEDNSNREDSQKCIDCVDCAYDSVCDGISKGYLKKYKEGVEPVFKSSSLRSYYERIGDYLEDEGIVRLFNMCLDDFCSDERFGYKKIYFRDRISTGSDDFREGFYYSIINSQFSFDEDMEFMVSVFGKSFYEFKKYLSNVTFYTTAFEILSDCVLRKKLIIPVSNMDCSEILEIFSLCGFKYSNLDGLSSIKIDLSNEPEIVEITKEVSTVKPMSVKSMFSDYDIEQKKALFRFLNSMHKDIICAKFKEKYENGVLVSRGFEVSPYENLIRMRTLGVLFDKNLSHLEDKEILDIWFEESEYSNEKFGFYYAPRLPKREPEIEERTWEY